MKSLMLLCTLFDITLRANQLLFMSEYFIANRSLVTESKSKNLYIDDV